MADWENEFEEEVQKEKKEEKKGETEEESETIIKKKDEYKPPAKDSKKEID